MDFYEKAKAQMKELQDEYGDKLNIQQLKDLQQEFGNKLNFQGSGARAPVSTSASESSAPTNSSYAGTPAGSSITPSTASAVVPSTSSPDLSVTPNDAPGAPGPKLPLTARKSVRDDFDSKKDDLVQKLSSVMGTPWSIYVDVGAIYTYAMEERTQARDNPGRMLYSYFEHGVRSVEDFVRKYGDDGRAQLNKLASSHVLTLEPALNNEIKNTSKNPSSCDVHDGTLRILFAKNKLGQNTSSACAELGNAVSGAGTAGEAETGAGGSTLNLAARNGIRTVYEAQVGKLLEEVRTILAAPTLEFVPNFEANYAAVRQYVDANGDRNIGEDWDSKFGDSTLKYFNGFKFQLERQRFPKDEMLQEGFQEAVEKNEIHLRVVKKLAKKKFNDCVIEGGVLYIQVVPEWWRSNVNDAGEGLVNML